MKVGLSQDKPFVLNQNTVIIYPEQNVLLARNAGFLSEYLKASIGYTLKIAPGRDSKDYSNAIVLGLDENISGQEEYVLTVTRDNVCIKGKTEQGVFYGVQTLRKAIPAETTGKEIILPGVQIKDSPRFTYRGMHLDVARHFFPVEFVKKYIDLLALHNMNTFHWHLTDDQGWRIEIKKYPGLTEVGSQRKQTVLGRNTQEYDNTPHGGFYSREQAEEIVEYAKARYITVIPEIDLPGHMLGALAAYPELGCTGGPYETSPRWGVFDDVLCIGNDKAMEFLEDVMSEIISMFPSEYIHIGGDEAPRTRWKICPKCQTRIKTENLKADRYHTAEDRLQSYCMNRIERFLNGKGRKIIGWDEILEGDVAPNATVMSWRGMDGGIEAAKLGHDVIMTPHYYVYFDYYQTIDTQNEPLAIGGYISLEKVYSLEPVPEMLDDEQKKHILGAQANLWTEYIPTTRQVEYMLLPRIAAISEVQWTQPDKKDYHDFVGRLLALLTIYQRDELNYARHIFDINTAFEPKIQDKAVYVTLHTIDNAPVYYTLDGTEPTVDSHKYDTTLYITSNVDFRALAMRENGKSREVTKKISFSKSTIRPVELKTQPTDVYKAKGAITLVDGIKGSDNYATGDWLGFLNSNVESVIDLEKETEISRVSVHTLVDIKSWIMGCIGITIAVSSDKKSFFDVAEKEFPVDTDINKKELVSCEVLFPPLKVRYVKIVVRPSPALPKGHSGENRIPYMFISEIDIE